MSELISFELEDGGSVVAVAAASDTGVVRASRGSDAIFAATTTFEASLKGVRDAAASALRYFRNIPQPPDEVSIEFGVQLSAQAGALIAQTAAEGHLQITLTWKRPTPEITTGGSTPSASEKIQPNHGDQLHK